MGQDANYRQWVGYNAPVFLELLLSITGPYKLIYWFDKLSAK